MSAANSAKCIKLSSPELNRIISDKSVSSSNMINYILDLISISLL